MEPPRLGPSVRQDSHRTEACPHNVHIIQRDHNTDEMFDAGIDISNFGSWIIEDCEDCDSGLGLGCSARLRLLHR